MTYEPAPFLSAPGAGRSATQGGLFDCGTYSGQGGAFRQIGDTKVAAFTVVNALGVVTDREGRIVRCHRDPAWGNVVLTAELLAHVSAHKPAGLPGGPSTHTTISLVVTNRQMSIAELQRLPSRSIPRWRAASSLSQPPRTATRFTPSAPKRWLGTIS